MIEVYQLFDFFLFIDDHSRVVLNTSTTESDYINANYIEVSLHVTWLYLFNAKTTLRKESFLVFDLAKYQKYI